MRIAYLSSFYPLRGGIAQFNASLYRAFEAGHEIKAYTFSRQYPDFLFPGKTQYVTESDNADPIPSTAILDTVNPFSYGKTARTINQWKPDILLMKYWMPFFGPSLGTVAKKMKSPTKVISILDNVIPHEKRIVDDHFNGYFLKQCDGFVVMSDAVKNDLLTVTNGKATNYLRANHPIYDHFGAIVDRNAACAKLNIDPDKKNILFFGFIRDYKGLDLLIDAFGQLDESYQLIVAGESYSSFAPYQQRIDNSPLKDNIRVFNDYIGDDEVPYFFSAADVCALPYKSATQSGITSIAYHFDLPIVATDVGGLKETIHDGKTGLIVEEVSVPAIAASLRSYFEQGGKSAFASGIHAFKAEHSWAEFAKKIIDFSQTLS